MDVETNLDKISTFNENKVSDTVTTHVVDDAVYDAIKNVVVETVDEAEEHTLSLDKEDTHNVTAVITPHDLYVILLLSFMIYLNPDIKEHYIIHVSSLCALVLMLWVITFNVIKAVFK